MHTFVFATFFAILGSIIKKLKTKISRRQRKNPKKTFEKWPTFELFWGNQNGHPELHPHAYVLAEIVAVIRKS